MDDERRTKMKNKYWILIIIGSVILSLIVGTVGGRVIFPKEIIIGNTEKLEQCQSE